MDEEKEKKRLKLTRPSNFGGTFIRLTMDGSKEVVKGKPTSAFCNTLLKPQNRRGPIKKIAWDHGTLPSTNNKILELLHDFVNQFLSGGYNVLMQSIRQAIEKEHHSIQQGDVIIFFQVAQFITSYQYHRHSISKPTMEAEVDTIEVPTEKDADRTFFRGDICGPIATTMNSSMFQLVLSKWRGAFEGLKETHDYKYLSAAGSLMKNMIRMLDLVLKVLPEDSKEPQTARILLYKLFYDQTEEGMTHFLISLVKSFDTHKQPRSVLADLVEMVYKVLRLMESLQASGTLRVSKKSRKGRKRRKLSEKETENKTIEELATNQKDTDICNGEPSTNMSVTEKRSLDTRTIPGQPDEGKTSLLETENLEGSLAEVDLQKSGDANGDLCYSTGDSSGDEQVAATNEVDFKVTSLVSAFSNNSIIQKLCWLLKFYKSNLIRTNHYIICLLRRISDDLELSPMLYQLSLLSIFNDILDEQKSCPCTEYENIVAFLKNIVRKMLKKMKQQPLLFVEILFWKTRKECQYINAEYLLHELGQLRKESRNWGDSLEDGEVGPSKDKGWTGRSIADALGEDEADVVLSHGLGHDNDEENSGVKGDAAATSDDEFDGQDDHDKVGQSMRKETGRVPHKKKRIVIGKEMEMKIKDLYEKFKDSQNCSELIAENLDPDGNISSTQISNKLKKLGLKVARRKRLRHAHESVSAEPSQIDGDGEETTNPESNTLPLHTRKRVRGFSEEKEATASQVSHKLKQLGLHIPQKKRSGANMLMRDKDLDSNINNMDDSDDETLLSLMNRGKKDKIKTSELPEQTTGREVLKDDSDDEMLSSVHKKARGSFSKSKDQNLTASSIQGTAREDDLEIGIEAVVSSGRDVNKHTNGLEFAEIDDVDALNHASSNGSAEAEVTSTGSGNPLDATPVEDFQYPQKEIGLDNSGDETHIALPQTGASRRKMRIMVLEDEDDE